MQTWEPRDLKYPGLKVSAITLSLEKLYLQQSTCSEECSLHGVLNSVDALHQTFTVTFIVRVLWNSNLPQLHLLGKCFCGEGDVALTFCTGIGLIQFPLKPLERLLLDWPLKVISHETTVLTCCACGISLPSPLLWNHTFQESWECEHVNSYIPDVLCKTVPSLHNCFHSSLWLVHRHKPS